MFEHVPEELKVLPQWVCHRNKIPFNPRTGKGAKARQPDTWATFEEAVQAANRYDGIGFEFNKNGLVGIDLDTVRDPVTGWIDPLALEIIEKCNSYTEISPSGYGFHIVARVSDLRLNWNKHALPANQIVRLDVDPKSGEVRQDKDGNPQYKHPEVEMYIEGRYFTVTGDVFDGRGVIKDATSAAQELQQRFADKLPQGSNPVDITTPQNSGNDLAWNAEIGRFELTDEQIIERIKHQRGTVIAALWDGDISSYKSHSEADLALCNELAFWCCKNVARMDQLFRRSGLFRPQKWDRPHSGSTWGALQLEKAVRDCKAIYDPSTFKRIKAEKSFMELSACSSFDLAGAQPEANDRYGWHDIGNGNLFADWAKDRARCIGDTGCWYVYDGKRWVRDPKRSSVMNLCKQLSTLLYAYAGQLPEGARSNDYIDHVKKWRNRNRRETIVKDAADVHPINMQDFDKDPYLLNCQNGTLNLRTGEFHSHRGSDMLTMIANVKYVPGIRCERWAQFINEVMQGDTEKALFFQKALGYSLTGDTRYECFFIPYGATTRNGKGTSMETFKYLMGDYAAAATPETIALKRNPDSRSPSEDLASLAGKRFVNISEPENGLRLSAALVKTISGNDTIRARFLGENSFEYVPSFKLFLNTNFLPKTTDPTLFSSGRVRVIPFDRHFEEHEQDKGLKEFFRRPESMSGILNWCIEGLQRLNAEGFGIPDAVAAATAEYQKASDKMGQFFEEMLVPDPLGEIRMDYLYEVYCDWCRRCNCHPEAKNNGFNSAVERYAEVRRKRPVGAGRNANAVSMALGFHIDAHPSPL